MATLEDGDCFGEVALVMDRPRNATLRALTPSIVLTLDRQNFQKLLHDSPGTQVRISALVRERMEARSPVSQVAAHSAGSHGEPHAAFADQAG